MKKILTMICSLLLLGALTLTVSAAAYMGLSLSASTLSPGDSFTVYVNLSNDQAVGRGGIVLNYDTAVFEFLGGSCGVSGATLAEVSAGRNGGVFALAENRVVSGTIFTINMRVRDTASQGSYTISGTASMDVPCSAGSCTVTVVCQHQYSYTSVDDTYHRRTCSRCGSEEIVSHSWGSAEVTQQPTCTDTGLALSTCTECGQTRQQTLPTNQNHVYSSWQRIDENNHSGKCDLCGQSAAVAHTWNEGVIVEPASCTGTGMMERACTGCGEKGQVQIPMDSHSFTGFQAVDAQTHHQSCSVCGLEQTISHSFGKAYRHNANEHYQLCDLCGYQSEGDPHTPGADATFETPQLCIQCNRVLKPAGNHVHSFQTQWSMDEQTHFYACDGCDEQSGLRLHQFTDDCDTDCGICGYVRTAPHDFDDDLSGDIAGHFHVCLLCGEKSGYASHTPGDAATISAPQTCTDCGFELAPRVGHSHEFSQLQTTHAHVCVCGETAPAASQEDCPYCAADPGVQLARFPWWILCIAEGLAIAALLILPNLKEKKRHK